MDDEDQLVIDWVVIVCVALAAVVLFSLVVLFDLVF